MENIYAKQDLTSHELQLLSSEMDRRKKSTATTWILWVFLGNIGAHRYYLGKVGTGVAMTLTLGCLGIWTLVDLFLINGMINKKNTEIESGVISELNLMSNARKKDSLQQ